ncbi:MAG: glycoside hydrolase family 2 protein [Armatimonadota bacterium]
MQREIQLLNRDWSFSPTDHPGNAAVRCPAKGWTPVVLPHQPALLPANYFSEKRSQFVYWYRRHLPTPAGLRDGRVFLDFDGVMMVAEVVVNGQPVYIHRGGYVGFSVDITPFLRPREGADNVIAVRVDARLHDDIPPCGRVMDFQTFGGIYRDVRLRVVPACYLDDLFVQTPQPLAARKTVTAAATIRNTRSTDWQGAARLELCDLNGKRIVVGPVISCSVPAEGTTEITLTLDGLTDLELWTLDNPQRYQARIILLDGRRTLDRVETAFGFREAIFSKAGPFLLNGEPLKLIGLNRHQTYPYIGAAAPARLQRRDADILKYELGCNVVRTSHYPQSPHFLDRCDEIGLLVFEEIPGWGFIGDEGWKELACRDVEMMICRDRNHPSIILWGVRINESADDHDLYTRTNALARALDPSRPTGGVRWGINSEFLEDVFTANDYAYNPPDHIVNEPPVTPYLVTEYGPLTDARRTAHSEILVNFAMVHADILNAVCGHPKIAGAIGWCAFDYHSQDWVTVDSIQPWGACDVFRAPKLTASLYASQLDPAVRPILQAATRWKVGDQAGFDPNEQTMKAGHDAPLVVFTNCDRVQVYIGGTLRGEFTPARDRFPHLPHPPVFCTGLGTIWGPEWQELHLVGWVGDAIAAEQRFPAHNDALMLDVSIDDTTLTADGADMTRVVLRHTDEYGNVQAHSRLAVLLEVAGPATLIGPTPCALAGGVTAVYLRAGTEPGHAMLTVSAPELGVVKKVKVRIR